MTQMDDLRFPIGGFKKPESISAEMRAQYMDTLRQLPERLSAAVAGLSAAQLDAPYREGGWTLRQVVHHVADSHANAYVRFKLSLTEDWPTIKPYDEAEWAKLGDSRMPVDSSLDLVAGLHARWVALLEWMTAEDFQKGYIHPKMGRQTLELAMALYAWHSLHHTAHITSLRARQGW